MNSALRGKGRANDRALAHKARLAAHTPSRERRWESMHEVEAGAAARVASWLELSAGALEANVATLRALSEDTGGPRALGAVLKGNAYGHGLEQLLPLVHPRVDVLYFITPGDALTVRALERERGLEPKQVLVIGVVDAREALALARARVDVVLGDSSWRDTVAELRRARPERPLRVHLHVDTGLGREGFTPAQIAGGELDFLRDAGDVLEVVGVLATSPTRRT